MLVAEVRSDVVEARHPVTAVAADAEGRILASDGGDLDTTFWYRSAVKPFQAAESQASGAALLPEELAVISASHGGQPLHIAYVRRILARAGVDERRLLCPPSWPLSDDAARTWARLGVRAPLPVMHNCSGKHAGLLAACAASGWPLSYDDAAHPLQRRILARIADVTGDGERETGVDGCGIPTIQGTVAGLARAFARLAADPEYGEVRTAMSRFGSLTSDGERAEARLARWVPAAVKGGARGCLGLAWYGGIGVAAKCWTGHAEPAALAVVALLEKLGLLPAHPREMLEPVARPPVLGGGRPVGTMRPMVA